MDQFGHGKGTIYGGCSEYTIIPAKYAYLLTTDLTDSQAALLERKLHVCISIYNEFSVSVWGYSN